MSMTGKAVYEETAEDWDDRFESGWEKVGGTLQSMQFAQSALAHIKHHLPEINNYSEYVLEGNKFNTAKPILIRDYGCALGDGTAILKTQFPACKVVGHDFSPLGVKKAQERWPTIEFEVGDINDAKEAHIIWTSHVIEHVPDAVQTTKDLIAKCSILVVLYPPITEEHKGGHEGSLTFQEYYSQIPEPTISDCFNTFRMHDGDVFPEGSHLLIWVNQP